MDKIRAIGGGFSPVQPATEYIQKLADGVRKKAEKNFPKGFDLFKVISYRVQLVIGKNYIVTVQVSFESFVVLEIFVTPEDKILLAEVEELLPEKVIPRLSKPVKQPLQATPRVQDMVDGVKQEVEAQTGQRYKLFIALSFRAECLSGINYLVVVQVSKESVLQLAMFEDLYGVVTLSGIKNGVPPCIPASFGPVPQILYNPDPNQIPKMVNGFLRQAEHQLDINVTKLKVFYYALQIADGFISYEIAAWAGVDEKSVIVIKLFQTLGGQVQLTLADLSPVEPSSIPSKYCQGSAQWTECPYEATTRIQNMVDEVKHEVEVNEQKTGTLKAISFLSRSADGINFLIRVQLTNAKKEISFLGLGIYESLDGKIALTGIMDKISPLISEPFYPIPELMWEPATESIQKMINAVKVEAATRMNMVFKQYVAVCYSSKVNDGEEDDGEGIVYYINVWISDPPFMSLKLLVSLEGKVALKNPILIGVAPYIKDISE